MALVLLFSHRGFYQIYRFRQERLQLEQENARLAAENARLARTIDRLQHDPEYDPGPDPAGAEFRQEKRDNLPVAAGKAGATGPIARHLNGERRLRPGSRPLPRGKPAPRNWSPDPGRVSSKEGRPPP